MRLRAALLSVGACVSVALGACSNPLGRQYEYDEQTYLKVNASATVTIAASVPALVALRGVALDPAPQAPIDTDLVRRVFEAAGCQVERVTRPWRRSGRRFVQVRIRVDDIRRAGVCGPLAWSTYTFEATDTEIRYSQVVGAPTPGPVGNVNWDGTELIAFKMHLPSRITFQNVRRLEDNTTGTVERGNILTWEQRLTDRRAGTPLVMNVTTDAESILYRTLFLFAGAFAAAVLVLLGLIWFTVRRGRARARRAAP